MYLPDIELYRATTLDEASSIVARHGQDARLLAGGTDLLVDLKAGRVQCRVLVSLDGIDALRGISETARGLRIGARTTITQLSASAIVRDRFAPLLDASTRMAACQVRNVATVGGNIASAVPCADLPPILIAMNAAVVLWSAGGPRELPLEQFFVGARQTVRREDEILLEVIVPAQPAGSGAAYARFQLRDGNAIAVAGVAASLRLDERGVIEQARVVLGAVAPIPRLVEAAGTELIGQPPGDAAFAAAARIAMEQAEPISDIRGSAEYRRELVSVLTQRALATSWERAQRT